MKTAHVTTKERLASKVYRDPRYAGKQVIIIGGKIIATSWGSSSVKLLKNLLKRYPHDIPTIVYVPKAETLILVL